MARFYKTASANPLDYMYRINVPLMRDVILANDQYITQNLQQADQLNTLASTFPFLQADEGRAKEIVDSYSGQIDEITKAIRTDPANWRKQLDPMRNLSRDLQQNIRVGEIGKITGNYSQYKTVADSIDKQVEEFAKTGKGISSDRAKAYKEYFLNSLSEGTKYNPTTGEYNRIKTFSPMSNIDIRKLLGEELDKVKADKTSYKKDEVTGQEWYFNRQTNTWEGVTPEKILSIVTDRLNNPQLMDYLKQDSEVGLINGVFDDQGKFIAPYNYKGVEVSPQEQASINNIKAQIAKTRNPNLKNQLQSQLNTYEGNLKGRKQLEWGNSYLAPIMRGLVNEYSYNQTSQENLLRNNSRGSTLFTQAQTNARQAANLAQQKQLAEMREKGVNDRFKENLDFQKYKWENPHTTAKAGSKPTTKGKEKEPLIESTVSRLNTNSFEDWTTISHTGNVVKVLSGEGLSSDINRMIGEKKTLSKDVEELDKLMSMVKGNRKEEDLDPLERAEYNEYKVRKQSKEVELSKVGSELSQRDVWYKASTEAALTNAVASKKDSDGDIAADLTPEEVKLYKDYIQGKSTQWVGNHSKLEELQDFVKGIKSIYGSGPSDKWAAGQIELLKKVEGVKSKVDQRRDNFLAQMRYTPIDTDAIQLGEQDSKIVSQILFSNPQGLKLYDNTGNKTDKLSLEGKGISWFNPKGDNYSMSTTDNSLLNYMVKHNVTPMVEQVGNTTKIGTGNAIVKVIFKDPNGEIPKTPFYVEVTPELQKQMGTILSKNKNPDVQRIAGSLLDDEANSIRRQLITPTVQRTAGKKGIDPATYTIYIDNGNQRVPFQVTKFVAEDDQVHYNITGAINGVQTPLPNTQSGIPGWFNGPDDFINYIKSQRNR